MSNKSVPRMEIDELKAQWVADPCWDIEETRGFEEHHDELLLFRQKQEQEWEAQNNIAALSSAQTLGCSPQMAGFIAKLERRLQEIERKIERLDGEHSIHRPLR